MQFFRFGTLSCLKYCNMLDDLGGGLVDHMRKNVHKGHELCITFDNFDFRILTN